MTFIVMIMICQAFNPCHEILGVRKKGKGGLFCFSIITQMSWQKESLIFYSELLSTSRKPINIGYDSLLLSNSNSNKSRTLRINIKFTLVHVCIIVFVIFIIIVSQLNAMQVRGLQPRPILRSRDFSTN